MTCKQAQDRLPDLFDAAAPENTELKAHVANCPDCASEYSATAATLAAIRPVIRMQASQDFKERVMSRAVEPEPSPKRFVFPRFVFAAVTVLLLIALAPLINTIGRREAPAPVLSLLAQSVHAMSNVRSVHITARMRTTARENFEFIDPARNWVPLEIWSEAGPPARWRVEKPERVVAMDGSRSMLIIRPDYVAQGTPRTNYLEWMRILLDPEELMQRELDLVRASDATASLTEENTGGRLVTVLKVTRQPRSPFPGDWGRNKSISGADHTRIYRFDAISRRLESMQIIMQAQGRDVPVFEILTIRYGEAFDPALFALTPPEQAILYVDPEQMPLTGPLPQSPKEAARILFEAFAREDWEAARLVYPMSGFREQFKQQFGGLQLMSLGEPFRSGFYGGWYVPYEIRLRSGAVKKWNLAVRNDNSVRRWIQDGGL